MISRLVLVATALLASSCASAPPASPRAEVFLLMGQSNMSGRGALEQAPAVALAPDPRIRMLGNDGVVRIASEPVDVAMGQLDQVSADTSAGVGPSLAFAKALLEVHPQTEILLVPCAKGGSPIAAWAPSTSRETLYGSCLARAHAVAEFGQPTGVLWYQGESDAATPALASSWPAAFENVVASLRRDLAAPRLPFVMVAIGDPPISGQYATRFPEWSTVQSLQKSLQMEGLHVLPAAGLARNDDQLHLSTQGQIDLGRRLATVWLDVCFCPEQRRSKQRAY